MTAPLGKALATLSATLVVVACSADPGDEASPADETEEALTSPRSVHLMYEGTCAFLHNCSSWSRRLPAGQVQWGCGGTTCDDDAAWVAGPSRSYCNKQVKICRGSSCVTAKVKDISVAKGWEGSNGVLDALDMDHTVSVSACSGTGGGRVTVQVL